MEKKRILIVGDSFCAPGDYPESWHQKLAKIYTVDNFAQSGVGQYKIHQQLEKAQKCYDVVLYNVTSPNRIHIEQNLFYDHNHPTHSECDLIYNDVKSRLPNRNAEHIVWWFENVFDINQAQFVHKLIVSNDCAHRSNLIAISFFDCAHIDTVDILSLHSVWQNNPGMYNHLNQSGHDLVFDILKNQIKNN
jgi:hypothetical protein